MPWWNQRNRLFMDVASSAAISSVASKVKVQDQGSGEYGVHGANSSS